MRIAMATAAGAESHPNEDFLSIAVPAAGSGGFLVLLDGVTPPAGDDGCVHSVHWFTSRLGGALGELGVSHRDSGLQELLAEALSRTAAAHGPQCDLSHPRTPQSTVVLARWDSSTVEYLVLSDSALLLESPRGEVHAVVDDRLQRVPRELLRSVAETDARLRNKEGGFFTAAADPTVARRAVTGRVPRTEVRALAALTDGAGRWVETFREGDWTQCLAYLHDEGPEALIQEVRAREQEDAEERRSLGRSKTHDDAAAAYVLL